MLISLPCSLLLLSQQDFLPECPAYVQIIAEPALTFRFTPVMWRLPSEARNITASAVSCASTRHLNGLAEAFFSMVAASHTFFTRAVSVVPGETVFTVIPYGPNCLAR